MDSAKGEPERVVGVIGRGVEWSEYLERKEEC